MTPFLPAIILALLVHPAAADTIVPTRTIRATAIIVEADVKAVEGASENAFDRATDVIGQEARVTLFPGRPIRFDEVGPPALVARNQIVSMRFEVDGLTITTDGRSLERGGVGDRVRIMNLSSRNMLLGEVQPDGTVRVYK